MISGHFWTLRAHFGTHFAPPQLPASAAWSTRVEDAKLGPVRLSGQLHEAKGSDELVLIVHGLGGSSESAYVLRAADAAARAGLSCLRINLRGADLKGEDLFHAGLASDLDAALATPELAHYRRVSVFGYSLGGHVALRFAGTTSCARLKSVVAVSPPLDLSASATAFDAPRYSVYRVHVMRSLVNMYREFHARRPSASSLQLERVARIRSIREWDAAVVVPRWGFASAADYYEQMSAARVLDRVRVPTLIVHAMGDPMVPLASVEHVLGSLGSNFRVEIAERGGHVGYPSNFSLGQNAPAGLEAQALAWLRSH